ncbi:SDR family oxidoreductase [Agrobacterium tumefaciens]|nr:SDR family oxidoreductase [Agrobacterium tumefaciens]NTD91556.1 SDR family oxidoreductase [Agrobacterium tumefaciens]NTD95541.1 SDR family oxidoreductase [Agrobacterium tumefaciens]NTE11651.1 SDR family oxidoreductase [Agrobacterium tumefaciens]NTE25096.1 SDR family oxidoreductase [Agrobacterium tumefaciens]
MLSGIIDQPGFLDAIAAQTAFGRLGTPEEVARVVKFIASPDADWITGQLIRANGGMHL